MPAGTRATPAARARTVLRTAAPWPDLVCLAAAGLIVLRPLALFWNNDPEYAFGWGVPVLALYLFFERWRCAPVLRPVHQATRGIYFIAVAWAVTFLLGRMLLETVPDWRPGLWFCASLYAGAVIAWCWLRGGWAWARHFLFPVAFLLLSVPWLYNVEFPIVQGLMRWNAGLVAASLVLADIPARAVGNTLLLPTGQLGIEEACSGIRSLQAALMMGAFLGEFYRFIWPRRALLLLLSLFLAVAGNYIRLLFLAWSGARRGISSVTTLHDPAAGGILCFTIIGLWLVCLALRKTKLPRQADLPRSLEPRPDLDNNSPARQWTLSLLIAVLIGELFTQGWFGWREAAAPRPVAWTVRWPDQSAGYRETPIPASTHELLRDENSRAGTWTDARGWRWRALWFQYPPRAANRIASDLHNPEVCLAASGYRQEQDYGQFFLRSGAVNLPVHAYLFSSGRERACVFWIASLDREIPGAPAHPAPVIYGQSSSAFLARLLLWTDDAWRGIRELGSQTLEVSISPAPEFPLARRAFVDFARVTVIPLAAPPPSKAP